MAGWPASAGAAASSQNFLHTVPAYLPAKESGRYLLCADCYRAVLEQELPAKFAIREWRLRRRKGWR